MLTSGKLRWVAFVAGLVVFSAPHVALASPVHFSTCATEPASDAYSNPASSDWQPMVDGTVIAADLVGQTRFLMHWPPDPSPDYDRSAGNFSIDGVGVPKGANGTFWHVQKLSNYTSAEGTHTVQVEFLWHPDIWHIGLPVIGPEVYSYDFVIVPQIKTTPTVYTPVARSTMRRTKSYSIYSYLKPRHRAGTYPIRIYKYRRVSGRWKSMGYAKAKASDHKSFTKCIVKLRLSLKGRWRLRAMAPADADHFEEWSSGSDYVRVD
jgi:hypothetical protein